MEDLVSIEALRPEEKAQQHLAEWLAYMKKARPAISTTIPELDEILGGLFGLVVMGGGPGTGKTALAIQIAETYATQGGPVVYLSYEQGKWGFFARVMQRALGIAPKDQAKGLQGAEGEAYAQQLQARLGQMPNLLLAELPKTKDNRRPEIDPKEIAQRVVGLQATTGKTCLVVVDSLHYTPLGEAAAGMDGKRAIDTALHIFTQLQQFTKCTVLAIAHQTKGEVNARDNGLMSFSGSGTIAYAADITLQLTRAWGKDENGQKLPTPPEGPLGEQADWLKVAVPKSRMGITSEGIDVLYNLGKQIIGNHEQQTGNTTSF